MPAAWYGRRGQRRVASGIQAQTGDVQIRTFVVTWLSEMSMATGNFYLSVGLLITGVIIGAALIHLAVYALLKRFIKPNSLGAAIVKRLKGVTRLAIVLLGLVITLPAADFDPTISELVRQVLRIGIAVLLGWSAIVGTNATARWFERKHQMDLEAEDDNVSARRVNTQIRILRRIAIAVIVMVTAGAILVTFPAVRTYGFSLFASAGAAGIILGLAARPILTNYFAGLQIALTQPIRIEDVVIVEGQWGWIEEITTTYVVVRIWDLRRMIVPLSYFIEKPFENWTRDSTALYGVVTWHVDYLAPIEEMRAKLKEICAAHRLWDGKFQNLQVIDSGPQTITVRALVSAKSAMKTWDLRCDVREAMITWLRQEHPGALARVRADLHTASSDPAIQALSN